jgi:hypothetical protein
MITINDLRNDWLGARISLGDQIEFLEAGNRIHTLGENPEKATAAWLERLKQDWSLYDQLLIDYPAIH